MFVSGDTLISSGTQMIVCPEGRPLGNCSRTTNGLHGPDFLWLDKEEWPQCPVNVQRVSEDDPGVKEVVGASVSVDGTEDPFARLVAHFSDWSRLQRTVGWILFAMDNLKHKEARRKNLIEAIGRQENDSLKQRRLIESNLRQDQRDRKGNKSLSLPVEFVRQAEVVLVRYAQQTNFPDEYKSVGDGPSKLKNSKLRKLDPMIIDGLLRVGGRLERAHITYDAKHPILLPRNSTISRLLLEHIHRKVGHLGKNSILSELRQRYWMIGAANVIKALVHRCVTCRKYQAPSAERKMASLRANRLAPDDPSFTRTGVDYFGAFEMKRGRSIVKRYLMIFTCMSIRAVHLEMASCLDTDACINALRRFMARRGPVGIIHSDNGTNFAGAERELRQEIETWNIAKIQSFVAQKGISWQFNPPAAAHFGGVWERLIRSIRKVLYSVVHEQVIKLDDDGLRTLFCEVEGILNGRPLTESPSSPNELEITNIF